MVDLWVAMLSRRIVRYVLIAVGALSLTERSELYEAGHSTYRHRKEMVSGVRFSWRESEGEFARHAF